MSGEEDQVAREARLKAVTQTLVDMLQGETLDTARSVSMTLAARYMGATMALQVPASQKQTFLEQSLEKFLDTIETNEAMFMTPSKGALN